MPDFLDAECVFSQLFVMSVLIRKNWKIPNVSNPSYDMMFELGDRPSIAGFTIFVKDGRHCIGTSALRNQSRRFKTPVGDIFTKCAI